MEKFLNIVINVSVFIVAIYGSIYILSNYSAYSYLKGQAAFEDEQKAQQDITTIGDRGVVTTMFGRINISYPDHCNASAQSYFRVVVLTTTTTWFIFALIISALMLIISFFTKFRLNLLQFIFFLIVIILISSFVLQQWIISSDKRQGANIYHSINLLKTFFPICF